MIKLCPCQSKKDYQKCCGPYISGAATPADALSLMRSRYTAYSLADVDYIEKTMSGPASLGFDKARTKAWAESVIWLNLKILDSGLLSEDSAFVEFVASYCESDQLKSIHERSLFKKPGAAWLYTEGEHSEKSAKHKPRKISRNSPCPC